MKAEIEIKFLKINMENINKAMVSNKRFRTITKKTVKKLCKTIDKYFNDYNILTSTSFRMDWGDENGK